MADETSETTAAIRDHIDRERRVADAVLRSGDRVAYSQIMRAASDVEQFTIPIAEERDALRAEVEQLRALVDDDDDDPTMDPACRDIVRFYCG
jgi:hypothetical protein